MDLILMDYCTWQFLVSLEPHLLVGDLRLHEDHALVLNSQDLQSKFLAMKEDAEKQEDKLRFFAQVRTQHKLHNNNKNKIVEFQQFYTMRSWGYVRSQDNSVDADELEAALAHMKQMQNQQPAVVPPRLCFM